MSEQRSAQTPDEEFDAIDMPSEEIEEIGTPEGVDEAAIHRMHAVARLLDDGFEIPVVGIRVGIDPILGVLPVAGDTATAVVGLYIVAESARQGVSYWTIARMLLNILVDAAIGSIPIVGDVFDVFFRAHRRNLNLALEDLGASLELDD